MANLINILEETYNELVHKVSWPTRKELQSSAVLVLVASVIISLLIFVMDAVMGVNADDTMFGYKGVLGIIYELLDSL